MTRRIIKAFVRYAASAYSDPAPDEKFCHEIKVNNVIVRIKRDDKKENCVYISIRGTDDALDWLGNLRRWKTPFLQNTSVHSGFLAHLDYIYEQVHAYVRGFTEIYITGHSLGGAVATLMGAKISHLMPDVHCTVVTYGCPRVGDRNFKQFFRLQHNLVCYRVYNKRDIITNAPYFGFYHVGRKHRIRTPSVPFYRLKELHSIWSYYWAIESETNMEYYKELRSGALFDYHQRVWFGE